mmetsp:Transcript_5665/g.8010  ORF Transcript_5665/g.8010 Transcript_5665/m.8010 type:complete len:232 (-) Transcript_5665:2327-3022(-)
MSSNFDIARTHLSALRIKSLTRSTSSPTCESLVFLVQAFSRGGMIASVLFITAPGLKVHNLIKIWWQSDCTSGLESLSPFTMIGINASSFRESGEETSKVSMHANAAFRSGSASSILCLKGPKSTTRSILSSTVSNSTGVTHSFSKSLIKSGRWWAAAFMKSRAALLTSKFSSLTKCTKGWSDGLNPCELEALAIACFSDVTMVHLISTFEGSLPFAWSNNEAREGKTGSG